MTADRGESSSHFKKKKKNLSVLSIPLWKVLNVKKINKNRLNISALFLVRECRDAASLPLVFTHPQRCSINGESRLHERLFANVSAGLLLITGDLS